MINIFFDTGLFDTNINPQVPVFDINQEPVSALTAVRSAPLLFTRVDSVIPILAKSNISRLQLVSLAEQTGLSRTWLQTLKTVFHVMRLKYPFSPYEFIANVLVFEFCVVLPLIPFGLDGYEFFFPHLFLYPATQKVAGIMLYPPNFECPSVCPGEHLGV